MKFSSKIVHYSWWHHSKFPELLHRWKVNLEVSIPIIGRMAIDFYKPLLSNQLIADIWSPYSRHICESLDSTTCIVVWYYHQRRKMRALQEMKFPGIPEIVEKSNVKLWLSCCDFSQTSKIINFQIPFVLQRSALTLKVWNWNFSQGQKR